MLSAWLNEEYFVCKTQTIVTIVLQNGICRWKILFWNRHSSSSGNTSRQSWPPERSAKRHNCCHQRNLNNFNCASWRTEPNQRRRLNSHAWNCSVRKRERAQKILTMPQKLFSFLSFFFFFFFFLKSMLVNPLTSSHWFLSDIFVWKGTIGHEQVKIAYFHSLGQVMRFRQHFRGLLILCSQLTSLRQNILERRFARCTSGLISYKTRMAKRLSKIFCLRLVSWEQRIMMKTQSGSLKSYFRGYHI